MALVRTDRGSHFVEIKKIAWTAAIALVVVLAYQHVQASKSAGVSPIRRAA